MIACLKFYDLEWKTNVCHDCARRHYGAITIFNVSECCCDLRNISLNEFLLKLKCQSKLMTRRCLRDVQLLKAGTMNKAVGVCGGSSRGRWVWFNNFMNNCAFGFDWISMKIVDNNFFIFLMAGSPSALIIIQTWDCSKIKQITPFKVIYSTIAGIVNKTLASIRISSKLVIPPTIITLQKIFSFSRQKRIRGKNQRWLEIYCAFAKWKC